MDEQEKRNQLLQVGSRIRNLRLQKRMSQDELAKACGYSTRSTINKIELGVNDLPLSKIKTIANALDTTVEEILGLDEHKKIISTSESAFIPVGDRIKQRREKFGLSKDELVKSIMRDEDMQKIVDRVKMLRLKNGLSFQQLADRTGMSKSTLQRYESGDIANIPLGRLPVLASALGVSPIYLMGWTEEGVIKEQLSESDTKSQKDFNSIGKRIKERRKTMGLSQQELAEKIGYGDRSIISKIEKGEVDLSQSRISAVAAALNVSPSYLAGWEEDATLETQLVDSDDKSRKSSQIIGQRIKSLRKAQHLSAEDLASTIGVSPATIYRYESADIANMGIDKIQPLADALHTTPEYLLDVRDSTRTQNRLCVPLSTNLRGLRETRKITMKQTASLLGIPYTTYVNYEKGVREPNLEMLIRISEFYQVSIDQMLGRTGGEKYTMTITKINGSESVDQAIRQDEPMMAVISFDGSQAYVSHLDDGGEHHILLQKAGQPSTDIDKYFRIIFDQDGADWTFICPPDYKGITRKDKRIQAFYRDGIAVISEFLSELGYLCDIKIPKRYKRHLNAMLGE